MNRFWRKGLKVGLHLWTGKKDADSRVSSGEVLKKSSRKTTGNLKVSQADLIPHEYFW